MRTITIQIGNSDDKLTQKEWSSFYWEIASAVLAAGGVHFAGTSPSFEPWQNACWVVVVDDSKVAALREQVVTIRTKFRQESVAWTEGETAFV